MYPIVVLDRPGTTEVCLNHNNSVYLLHIFLLVGEPELLTLNHKVPHNRPVITVAGILYAVI